MAETNSKLEVVALDLGVDVRAVGLELIDPETREPLRGHEAAEIWARTLPALAGKEPWALDFFAHLDRVRSFCNERGIAFREPNAHALVIEQPAAEMLPRIFERFAPETFGARAGSAVRTADSSVENGLASRGVDAYHTTFPNYFFCAVCDFEEGFLTVLSTDLWASEVIRRARTALQGLPVEVTRPA